MSLLKIHRLAGFGRFEIRKEARKRGAF